MAIYRKKRDNGTLSENWYYKFVVNGQRYRGSTYKSNKNEAHEFEEDLKRKIQALYDDRPVVSEKEKERNLLNFREKITSEIQGESIALDEAWDVFKVKAPAMMKKIPNEKGWAAKKTYWEDFLAFVKHQHPACNFLRDIRPELAQEYVGLLKTKGKFNKDISCKGSTYQNKVIQLSPSTINEYIVQIKQIFRILSGDAGLMENPFEKIQKLVKKSKKREVFEIHELEKINQYLKEFKENPSPFKFKRLNFTVNEAIFIIGINTGMRKGDICQLKWSDVDFTKRSITKELSKTKESVFIPISSVLYSFLQEKAEKPVNEYVTPELAEMYKENPEGISYRFKQMLSEVRIRSVKSFEERSRRISTKDIHSLRHTFCYLHGMQGTPLVVVQSMVGHMDKKMTESYMMHQTEELKRDAIERLAFKGFSRLVSDPLSEVKMSLIKQIEDCQSRDLLARIDDCFKNNNSLKLEDQENSQGMKW